MRWWILPIKLALLGAIALPAASCGVSSQSQRDDSQSADVTPIEDSGKRLAGNFVLSSLENSYGPKNAPIQPQTVFTFDESGNFKKQDKSRTEEGTYVIGTKGELVLYVEKVNGEQLAAARLEAYSIGEQADDRFTLLSGHSQKLFLQRR